MLLSRAWSADVPVSVPEVEALTAAAREAGVRAHWVYPPDGDRNDTSLRRVIELEALDGEFDTLAEHRARDLRREFSSLLTNLGDSYWDRVGGRHFARDYYLQALSFDLENEHARSRSGATPGMLAEFVDKAARGGFTEFELQAAAPLVALAEPDEARREEILLGLTEEPASSAASLDRLLASTSGKTRQGRPKRDDDKPAPPRVPAAPPEEPPAVATTPDPEPTEPDNGDMERARHLVEVAARALAEGKRREAESLYHQALAHDDRNAAALIGLGDLEFDSGNFMGAAEFAEKAVAIAPRNGNYHMRLGDAYFRLLRYADARRAYETAKDLGVSEAVKRLARLKAKLADR